MPQLSVKFLFVAYEDDDVSNEICDKQSEFVVQNETLGDKPKKYIKLIIRLACI